MVQDSITDHIDTTQENSSHLNFTYRLAIILQRLLLDMLPTVLKVTLFSNNKGQKTPVMLAVIDFS